MNVCHIIAAGGIGSRFGAAVPKQFCELLGRPVLMHTILALRRATPSARIVISLHPEWIDYWQEVCRKLDFESPTVVSGGETRFHSVKRALARVGDAGIITVHDAARPLVTPEIVNAVVAAVEHGADGAIPAVPPSDSLRMVTPDGCKAVDRSLFRAVQTPQAFRADALKAAYNLPYSPAFTDDASVMEAASFTDIAEVEGSYENIKITHSADLVVAAHIMSSRK